MSVAERRAPSGFRSADTGQVASTYHDFVPPAAVPPLAFCCRREGESRRLDSAMIDPTEHLLENLHRVASVETPQRLDFLIPLVALGNG
jgi:hypothetical protein